METSYDGPYKERLAEIDNKIENLKTHMTMWSRAGSGRMAMQTVSK